MDECRPLPPTPTEAGGGAGGLPGGATYANADGVGGGDGGGDGASVYEYKAKPPFTAPGQHRSVGPGMKRSS